MVVVPVPRNEVAACPARQAEDVGGDTGVTYRNEALVTGEPAEVVTWVGPGPLSSRDDLTPPSSGDYVLGAARLAAQVANRPATASTAPTCGTRHGGRATPSSR